ncbi:MAG TPA: autotransporter-associated beta strand repeat-containing protein [Chthoniobacteraceae bacterium]|nr:autotransporter-associated beta strand repeat-containing protein [Chthoniobacteraceae bacterium]
MKVNPLRPFIPHPRTGKRGRQIAASLLLALSTPALALDGVWQSTSGSGNWNDPAQWEGDIAGGTGGTATFNGSLSSILQITLTEPVTVGHLAVTNWSGSRWEIVNSGVLTLDAGLAKPTITHPTLDSLRINTVIAGTNGFEKLGTGRLYLGGNNTFTGGVTITRGVLWTANAAALNSTAPNAVTLNGGSWLLGGNNATYNNNVVLADEENVISNTSAAGTSITLGGIISQTAATSTLAFRTNGSAIGYILKGDNTYTGNTEIGSAGGSASVVLRIEHDRALGTGTAAVGFATGSKTHDEDALEMAGGITVADKALTLRGRGRGEGGSLRSVSGDNTWAGTIDTGEAANARIGVDAGTLSITGQITGTSANGLTKVGEGTLLLAAENSYANGTAILGGTLHATHAGALAGGDLVVGDGTGTDTLRVGADTVLTLADLTLQSSAHLAFDLTAAPEGTMLDILGDQLGSGSYTIDIFDGGGFIPGNHTLLTVEGAFNASGFNLGITPEGYEGLLSLHWADGTLSLQAIPEPGTLALFGLAMGAGAVALRRSRRRPVLEGRLLEG